MHVGRSFDGGGHIEATCPCPLTWCGLVDTENVAPSCDQHPPMRCKTVRTGHPAEDCPGYGAALVMAIGRTEAARQRIIDVACVEPVGFVNASILDAIDEYRAAVEHEAAERIRAGMIGDDPHYQLRRADWAADEIDPEVAA